MRQCAFASKLGLLLGMTCCIFAPVKASAQQAQTTSEIIVYGDIAYGSRSEVSTNPTLIYDLEYFQRFEPISAGDALKRAPGVTFPGDVLEHDELQLRGLPSSYAQIQINGTKVEGSGENRVFFVDRIPAELIDGVEIIRSPSADMSADQLAGAVNVNLKRAGEVVGGWVRGSVFGVEDDELRGAGSIGYGGNIGTDTSYLFSADIQQRRSPKKKTTEIWNDRTQTELKEFETEEDTRDGTDYTFNGEVATKVGKGELRVYGYYVYTDRDEDELAKKYEDGVDDAFIAVTDDNLEEVATQHEDIKQHSFSVVSEYKLPTTSGEFVAKFGYASFRDDKNTYEQEGDTEADLEFKEEEIIDVDDKDYFGTLAYTWKRNLLDLKVGIDGRVKNRDYALDLENDDDELQVDDFDIREERIDPYIKANWHFSPRLKFETGLRYENTFRELDGTAFSRTEEEDINGNDVLVDREVAFDKNIDSHFWLPSVHAVYAISDTVNIRGSVARTVRRPEFDLLIPSLDKENPGEDDTTVGNPDLEQEKAWGVDLGFDVALSHGGLFGFNFFHREISDKIENIDTGEDRDIGVDTFNIYQYQNVGDAKSYGIEVDLSTPLTVFGLENTSIFANYTWLNTEFTDPVLNIKRRFNEQQEYVYNIGVIQSIPQYAMTMGVSYNKRGSFLDYAFDEVEEESIEGNLEAFIEKRFGDSFVVRLTGTNLLDTEKVEKIDIYDGQVFVADYDEFEIQREKVGPLFMLTGRKTF